MAECSGDPKHFDIGVISWQVEHFWANNWQGINNPKFYKIMIQWRNIFSFDFHHIPKLSISFKRIRKKELKVKKEIKVLQTVSRSESNAAVQWQKEATLENDISRKWAKCVCHLHWHQCNIGMSWLRYLSAGWVFLLQTWNTSRICQVQSENITFSNLGDLPVASFCQCRAEWRFVLDKQFGFKTQNLLSFVYIIYITPL